MNAIMRIILIALSLILTPLIACTETSPTDDHVVPNFRVIVAGQTATQCTPVTNQNSDFPEGVDRIEVVVSGYPSADTSYRTTKQRADLNANGEILVEAVPPGNNLQLDLLGCTDGELTWSGRINGLTVQKDEKTATALYFTRKNTFNCVGGGVSSPIWEPSLKEGRALHSTVNVANGRTLIVGGLNNTKNSQLSVGPTNTNTIMEYNPSIGHFRPWDAQLNSPRGWHHTVPFDNGKKVLVIGGVTQAVAKGVDEPAIAPTRNADGTYAEGTLPIHANEIIDVENKTVQPSPLIFNALPMSDVAHSPDGLQILVVGGETEDQQPSKTIQRAIGTVPGLSATVLKDSTTVREGSLVVARKGHTATWFENNDLKYVLVVGGNADGAPENIAEIVYKHTNGSVASALFKVQYGPNTEPLLPIAFHRTELVRENGCKFLFLVSGGKGIVPGKGIATFNRPDSTGPILHLAEVDVCDADGKGEAFITFTDQSAILNGIGGAPPLQRVLHTLTNLGDNVIMLGGGVHQFYKPDPPNPVCDASHVSNACYFAGVILFQLTGTNTSDAGLQLMDLTDLTFNNSRFGHDVHILADGTALVTGGLDSANTLSESAELFNPTREFEKLINACNSTQP